MLIKDGTLVFREIDGMHHRGGSMASHYEQRIRCKSDLWRNVSIWHIRVEFVDISCLHMYELFCIDTTDHSLCAFTEYRNFPPAR